MKFPFALRDVADHPASRFAQSLRKRRRGERDGADSSGSTLRIDPTLTPDATEARFDDL